jgi:hypothetical protein
MRRNELLYHTGGRLLLAELRKSPSDKYALRLAVAINPCTSAERPRTRIRISHFLSARCDARNFLQKSATPLDYWLCGVMFFIPREAGLLYLGVCSTYIWGLQIETQFCPGNETETRSAGCDFVGARLSFFVARMCGERCPTDVGAGSLTSTYRVVRKIQL